MQRAWHLYAPVQLRFRLGRLPSAWIATALSIRPRARGDSCAGARERVACTPGFSRLRCLDGVRNLLSRLRVPAVYRHVTTLACSYVQRQSAEEGSGDCAANAVTQEPVTVGDSAILMAASIPPDLHARAGNAPSLLNKAGPRDGARGHAVWPTSQAEQASLGRCGLAAYRSTRGQVMRCAW
jgi:hypothetical protein